MTDSFTTKLRRRLRECLRPRDFGTGLAIAALIAVLLTGVSAGAQSNRLLLAFGANFLFSAAITFSVIWLSVLSGATELPAGLKKGVLLTLTFAGGGIGGTFIALGILSFFWQVDLYFDGYADILRFNIFLAIFFGALVNSYFVLRERFHIAAAKLAEKEINEQKLIRLKNSAEIEALRAKIDPHFLFNTLNSIASLIPEQPAKAEQMVNQLANLFRAILESGNRDTVSLSQELATIREYLDIEKVRLGKRLTYRIDLDQALEKTQIPALLLQPLIENSIRHGIATRREGGTVSVRCAVEGAQCRIEIHDDGPGLSGKPARNGFGLAAVQERLALHYGANHSFELFEQDGVHIVIRIPGADAHAENHSD